MKCSSLLDRFLARSMFEPGFSSLPLKKSAAGWLHIFMVGREGFEPPNLKGTDFT